MTDLASREITIRPRMATVATRDQETDAAEASLAAFFLSSVILTTPRRDGPPAFTHPHSTQQIATNGFDQAPERVHHRRPEWTGRDDAMADVAAHLMSAHELLGELAGTPPHVSLNEAHAIHASRGIQAILTSLDERIQVDGYASYHEDPAQ
jgi:hypothetical protein